MTTIATAASAYALDVTATAAGVALVASGLLAGVDPTALVLVLVATYLGWGVALHANLGANWTLLTRTGASTSLASKVAHDVASARGCSVSTRRAAASTGYVATELAKEGLYYAAAGGMLVTGAGSTGDAFVFLAGTNVGAAAYEYGLSRATLTYLRRREPRPDGWSSPA